MNYIIELNIESLTKIGVESTIDFYQTMSIDQLIQPGLNAFVTGIDSASLNVVMDTKPDQEISSDLIHGMENFFKSYCLPWGWFITPISNNKKITDYGFEIYYETPGMYYDLRHPLPNIETMPIEIRKETDELHNWIIPLQESFPSTDNCEAYRKLNKKIINKNDEKLKQFTAYCNNIPAASGTLFSSSNAVMLHNLASRNQFRNRGIATGLMLYMMNEAKKQGYQHCFLDSSLEGFNLYKRIGFKTYCLTYVYIKKSKNLY